MISSHLSLPRGPKVSTASAAHEFLLNPEIELPRKWRPAAYRNRTAEYVNALTVATRVEFGLPDFDPRPAHRRRKALPRSKAIAK